MLSLFAALLAAAPADPGALRMNDIVAVGSHNSYKLAIPPEELAALPTEAARIGLDYSHRPIPDQLDAGARQLELDVYFDPNGGRYARPLTSLRQGATLAPDVAAALATPGFKVLHVNDVDFRSSCTTFKDCLTLIRTWSKAHADHVPFLILINAKDGAAPGSGAVTPLAFDETAFDALDVEIRAVFGPDQLITPDMIQGRAATLREAVLAGGWPSLDSARGKVFFALDESPAKVAIYRGARRSLEGRAMFVNTDEASPAAAYLTLNDPIRQQGRIQAAVKAGFMVRTRADAETIQARRNDTSMREAAFTSGAQYISTDYMWAEPRFPGGYAVRMPKGVIAGCNPVRAAERCGGKPVETAP